MAPSVQRRRRGAPEFNSSEEASKAVTAAIVRFALWETPGVLALMGALFYIFAGDHGWPADRQATAAIAAVLALMVYAAVCMAVLLWPTLRAYAAFNRSAASAKAGR